MVTKAEREKKKSAKKVKPSRPSLSETAPEEALDRLTVPAEASGEATLSDGDSGENHLDTEGSSVEVFEIIKDLEEHLEAAYAMQEALTQDRDMLNAELTRLRATCQEMRQRNRFLEEKVPDVEALRGELEFAEHERSSAQTVVTSLKAEVESQKQAHAALVGTLDTANAQAREAKAANIKLEFEISALKDRNKELKVSGENLAGDLHRVEKELLDLRGEQEQARVRIEELQLSLNQALSAQSAAEEELAEAKETVKRLHGESAQQTRQHNELGLENRQLRGQIATLEREGAKLKPQLARLEEALALAREEKERLETDLRAARKTVKQIHSALAGTRAKTHKPGPGKK